MNTNALQDITILNQISPSFSGLDTTSCLPSFESIDLSIGLVMAPFAAFLMVISVILVFPQSPRLLVGLGSPSIFFTWAGGSQGTSLTPKASVVTPVRTIGSDCGAPVPRPKPRTGP